MDRNMYQYYSDCELLPYYYTHFSGAKWCSYSSHSILMFDAKTAPKYIVTCTQAYVCYKTICLILDSLNYIDVKSN